MVKTNWAKDGKPVKQLIMDNPELAEELKQKIVATFNGKTDEPELAESANEETDN